MDTCVRCGAELGVGRFCLNCGHRIGAPAPVQPTPAPSESVPAPPPDPVALPVQAADPTPDPTPDPATTSSARSSSTWDPREDLLPYEEVDDVERDAPLRGYAWVAWVLGAVLLVALVFVLLDAFGSGDDDGTAIDPGAGGSPAPGQGAEGSDPAEAPAGVGRRMQLASAATFAVPATAPPTTDLDGNLVAYEVSQMHDANPRTTWRMAGDASGQTITVTLAEPAVVQRIGLVNGYTKLVAGVDWYPNNRRILTVTWTFEDGSSIDQTFVERRGLQTVKVPPVRTGTVDLQITSVTPPGSGNLGRDYTAISEVSIIGRRAG